MKLLYFAWVRQKIGKNEEDLPQPAGITTLRDLARHLSARGDGYAETFVDLARLRAAVNQVHATWDAPVDEADEIAFFPPVTGG